ncbi:DUF2314 domain-containing protein [Flavobacterium sp.]|uniref:DUF2314 domain-containing protein n=1 Tax=Flavobacterium sp. TaxID=239 RepID=UPI00286C4AA5|nr:DUF2314 domain-containing protein [Flavobacterium sp.]
MSKISTFLIIMILLSACSGQKRTKKWDKENVKLVNISDSSYSSAVQSAQEHLPEFITLLKERETNNYKFNISADYTEEGHTEQLWFMVDSFDNNIFYVKLNNVPLHFKNLKLNDKLEIHQDSVKDWLVSKNHKVIAGNFAKVDLN